MKPTKKELELAPRVAEIMGFNRTRPWAWHISLQDCLDWLRDGLYQGEVLALEIPSKHDSDEYCVVISSPSKPDYDNRIWLADTLREALCLCVIACGENRKGEAVGEGR